MPVENTNIQSDIFDLKRKRPVVLLLGNGINQLIDKQREFSLNKVVQTWCDSKVKETFFDKVPFPLLAMVYGEKTKTGFVSSFDSYPYGENDILNNILSLNYDVILTTNYTYEIENALDHKYVALKDKKRRAKTFYRTIEQGKEHKENGIMLQTYNQLFREIDSKPIDIWHIHGELRNSTSLVLTHDDYERLTGKINNYIKKRHNDYSINTQSFKFESWVDYMLFGDIYIVGLGLYFSEYDLWWLLNERKKYNINNKVVYYEPLSDAESNKHQLLKQLGVNVEDFKLNKIESREFDFHSFYKRTIKDIKNRIK